MLSCKLKILLISVFLVACGSSDLPDWVVNKAKQKAKDNVEVEPPEESLQKIVDSFVADCRDKYGVDVSNLSRIEFIRWGDPSDEEHPTRIGVCQAWYFLDGSFYKGHIIIKNNYDDIENKAILYHELGHCVLGLDHSTQEEKTIMSPYKLSRWYYLDNWDRLVKDLCLKEPK